jgi:NADP-dependent 3-hydroxy acid dehydrogenase YdfG
LTGPPVAAAQKLGGLHGLDNTGIYQSAALMETDDALWQRHIQINQYGCFLGMKAVVPTKEHSGGGSIVNISSVAGLKGSPGSFAYTATKWAPRGHDQVGGDRSRRTRDQGELGPSRSNRYRHDRVPHARATRRADEAGADAPAPRSRSTALHRRSLQCRDVITPMVSSLGACIEKLAWQSWPST